MQGLSWYGKFEIRRARRKYKWDLKDGAGLEGATLTYRGKRPEVFALEFFIWDDYMWTAWKAFSLAFQYKGVAGVVIPVSIQHPALAALNISAVICEDLGGLEKKSDDLMFSVTVMIREYFPPLLLIATDTPPGAVTTPPTSAGLTPNPAIAALEAKIASLQAAAAALGTPGGLP